jgi:hypothetical protein
LAYAECIEFLRAVEDEEAWKVRYPSLEAFYVAHQSRHPDIRLYGPERRDSMVEDPLARTAGRPSERFARRREQQQDS